MDDKEHHIKLTFDEGVYANLICEAPPESICHAIWSCNCESWDDEGIGEDGLPFHSITDDDDKEVRHIGTFKDHCRFDDFFDESGISDSPDVTINLNFKSEWQGDFFSFEVTGLK